MNHPELFTTEQAGIYLAGTERPVPPTTMQWWRTTGQGPRYIKVGRVVRYRRSDLDDFLEACAHEPEVVNRPTAARRRLTEREAAR